MPLNEKLGPEIDKSDLKQEDYLKEVIKTKSVKTWMQKVGVLAEKVIAEAFATGGFGKWKPHSPGYENNTGDILVDTTQLRDSISSEVK
jgi:phage gpG-like protein